MGQISVAQVVELLSAGGVQAEAAFPAERITRITIPVAAVSIGEVDQGKSTVTALVEILGPKESGGHACQQKALEACNILAAAGGVCRQSGCTFLSKGNVFRVQVEAEFSTVEEHTIVVAGRTLPYACSFSAHQKASTETGDLDGVMWEITLEELFPWGVQDTLSVTGPFQVDICCGGNIERYEECTWAERKRVTEKDGIRQIRKGTAMSLIFTA